MPNCPVEKVEEMVAAALVGRRRRAIPASDDLWLLKTTISIQLDQEDPGLTKREITRAEVEDGRRSVTKIEAILATAICRLKRDRNNLAAALANGTTEHPEFITLEVESYDRFGRKLADMQNGLSAYREYFSPSILRPVGWRTHAKIIHEAFLVSVPDNQGKAWGISENGPAVAFVRLALEYVLSFIKAVAKPTWQLPSRRSIADELRKSKKLSVPRPG